MKNSSAVLPKMSVSRILSIFSPDLLQVMILPSSLIVITALDILVSMLWL